MNEQNAPLMLTLREAAARSGLPYDRLRKMCLANELIHFRSGKKIYVNYDNLYRRLTEGDNVKED